MHTLGQQITVTHKLKRISKYVNDGESPLKYELKFWDKVELKTPIKGIVIGIRKLSNGHNHYIREYGNAYEPKEHFKALIVAYHLYRKPIFVKL